jgi:peptidoglycan/xylan/chitin deacetylase (PgdA/CDA1 family)
MFRLDRFLTVFFFHPAAKRGRNTDGPAVPILMYHGISNARRKGGHPYYETSTSPPVFKEHMQFLRANDYNTIGLEDLPGVFASGVSETRRCAVITFDDGLVDFFESAVSILKENGQASTVFLPAGLMGQTLAGQAVMDWDLARALAEKGVAFGSHSMTHAKLVDLTASELEREILGSKEKIETELDSEIQAFSYPYAFPEQDRGFIRRLKRLLVDSGYKTGVTTSIGRATGNTTQLFLKRIPVNDHDDLKFFRAKLEGGYDWLNVFQKILKNVSSKL